MFIISIIFLIITYLIFKKKNKLIFSLILGFAIPYGIFFIYLLYNNIFYDWISYLQLPKLYLSKYNVKIYQAVLNGTFYIFFKTWIEILYKPQNIITCLLYSLTILLISLIIIKKTSAIYGLLSLLIIFFNHPIPWLPWSNYYALFFLILCFFLLLDL